MKKCKNCNKSIADNDVFCQYCGTNQKSTTADDMLRYCLLKKTGNEGIPGGMLRGFKIIEKNLLNDENVLTCFMLMIGNSSSRVAGVLTNKRLIIAKNEIIGNKIISISINTINDIFLKNGLVDSKLVIDSLSEKVELRGLKNLTQNTYNELHQKLNEIKNSLINNKYYTTGSNSKYDELKKAKELLDSGILTQEEFENEKQKILN